MLDSFPAKSVVRDSRLDVSQKQRNMLGFFQHAQTARREAVAPVVRAIELAEQQAEAEARREGTSN